MVIGDEEPDDMVIGDKEPEEISTGEFDPEEMYTVLSIGSNENFEVRQDNNNELDKGTAIPSEHMGQRQRSDSSNSDSCSVLY